MNVSDQLWQTYRTELHRFVVARISDRDAAEDLVHDVLVRAYTKRDQLRDPESLRGWLYGITRNVIVDYYRAVRPSEPLPDEMLDESEAATAGQQLASCLEPLIRQLPREYGEALALSELQGIPQADVASRMGLSVSGAKSRVQRARRMLKDIVLECCRVEFDHQGRMVDYEQLGSCEAPCMTGDGTKREPKPQ